MALADPLGLGLNAMADPFVSVDFGTENCPLMNVDFDTISHPLVSVDFTPLDFGTKRRPLVSVDFVYRKSTMLTLVPMLTPVVFVTEIRLFASVDFGTERRRLFVSVDFGTESHPFVSVDFDAGRHVCQRTDLRVC